jgi:hypothetical protein
MSDTKFTKGPWEVLAEEPQKGYLRVRATIPGARYKIANVHAIAHYRDGIDYAELNSREAKETLANARLIAAAPELFEAVSIIAGKANDLLFSGELTTDEHSVIFAALAKATGEQA